MLAYLLLDDELKGIFYNENFIDNIKTTKWFFLDAMLKYIMIFASAIIFIFNLKHKVKEIKIFVLITFFFVLILGYYISIVDYFANI